MDVNLKHTHMHAQPVSTIETTVAQEVASEMLSLTRWNKQQVMSQLIYWQMVVENKRQ